MIATNPRTRIFLCRAGALGLALLLTAIGCKSKDGGGGTGGGRDPLVYGPNRIPPQNVPVPGRGGVGTTPKADPLIGAPTGRSDKSGAGYSNDASRFKGTYAPGLNTTPAALAGKLKDGDELKIDTPDNRVPLQPAGGVIPARAEETGAVDTLYQELKRFGIDAADRTLTREDGKYVFTATLNTNAGTKRLYKGVGDTAADSVKEVLQQVTLDRK